ncbi:hypothetical protein [Micromonospora coxensis]|uniref:hypothetical protein n=1 Tax=Micromonospora coxensis TaxID=356852 RepID=UPI000B5AD3C3|nr:hypothetical protein [Micromonospora coxensis]
MAVDADSGAVRELMVVLAVAGAGLLLAMVAAFGPWHPRPGRAAPAGLVELHSPGGATAPTAELTAG